MSTQDFRSVVFGLIDAYMTSNHPGVPVMYENGPEVDEEVAGNLFLVVELRFYSGRLMEVGQGARGRSSGAIAISAYARQATGTAQTDEIIDTMIEMLRSRRIASGLTRMPQRTVPNPIKGWYETGILVPFTVDDTVRIPTDQATNLPVIPTPPPAAPVSSTDTGAFVISFEAGQPLNAYKVVTTDNLGRLVYASADNPAHLGRVLGVTRGAGIDGQQLPMAVSGLLRNPGWSWSPGVLLYLGLGG